MKILDCSCAPPLLWFRFMTHSITVRSMATFSAIIIWRLCLFINFQWLLIGMTHPSLPLHCFLYFVNRLPKCIKTSWEWSTSWACKLWTWPRCFAHLGSMPMTFVPKIPNECQHIPCHIKIYSLFVKYFYVNNNYANIMIQNASTSWDHSWRLWMGRWER